LACTGLSAALTKRVPIWMPLAPSANAAAMPRPLQMPPAAISMPRPTRSPSTHADDQADRDHRERDGKRIDRPAGPR